MKCLIKYTDKKSKVEYALCFVDDNYVFRIFDENNFDEKFIWVFPYLNNLESMAYKITEASFYNLTQGDYSMVPLMENISNIDGRACYATGVEKGLYDYSFIATSNVKYDELEVYLSKVSDDAYLSKDLYAWPYRAGMRLLYWTADSGEVFAPDSGFALTLAEI
ncbi:hypothetical protein F9K79_01420 [Ochrobactrum sp. Kaboul]|nr:hypothetical protein F9K79_01420 [Ochrobactrum sp. Kaboul]